MSKILEHIIRKALLSEQTESDTRWVIPASQSSRGRKIDSIAKRLGAHRAWLVIGRGKNINQSQSANIDEMINFIQQQGGILRDWYNNGNYVYIFQQIKSKPNKVKFALLVDRKKKYESLIKAIKTAEARTEYYILQPNEEINKMGELPYMSGDDYRVWVDAINNTIEILQKNAKTAFQKNEVKRIKQLYDKVKFIDVAQLSKTDVPDVEDIEKIVNINISGFSGTAREITDATGRKKYIPVQGTQYIVRRDDDGNPKPNSDSGEFVGKFAENGMPKIGTVTWNGPRGASGILGGISNFKGEFFIDKGIAADFDIENPGFRFRYKSGYFVYYSGNEFQGSYKSADSQQWDGDGILSQNTDDASRKLVTENWTYGDMVEWIENSLDAQNITYTNTTLLYVIGGSIAFKGNFTPRPTNGILLSKSNASAYGNEEIGTIQNSKTNQIEFTEDFLTKLEEAKQEIDTIKIFEDETGDITIKSLKLSNGNTADFKLKKSNISDLKLLSDIQDIRYRDDKGDVIGMFPSYQVSYFNTDLNKRYPTPGKYNYYIKQSDLTPEFIELQKTLGNIK